MYRFLLFFTIPLMNTSCNSTNEEQLSVELESKLIEKGDSISQIAQFTLLQNVANAMQKGGIEYALDFCNVNAIPLTDSISRSNNVEIQRLSDKNRNPDNAIVNGIDKEIFEKIKLSSEGMIAQHSDGNLYYYKEIRIGMPTCLKCHGTKNDINENANKIILQKYPNDKAKNYQLGDLRGMWIIKLDERQN